MTKALLGEPIGRARIKIAGAAAAWFDEYPER